ELEEHRRLAGLVALPGVTLHRDPPRVRLHAPAPPARADRAVVLHDHVAELARRSAPEPGAAVEEDRAAHARSPEHPEERGMLGAGPELELRVRRHLHIVAERDGNAELTAQRVGEREGAIPAGEVLGAGDRARRLVDDPGRAHADA